MCILRGAPAGNDQTFARGIAHDPLTGGHHFLMIQIGKIDILLGFGGIQIIFLLKKVIKKIVPSRYSNLALSWVAGNPSEILELVSCM